jgi:hypothetical protein
MKRIANLTAVLLLLTMPLYIIGQNVNDGINRNINEINRLLKPKNNIDAINGFLVAKTYKNNELIKQARIDIAEIIDANITYNSHSKFLNIKCIDFDCVENKFYGNIKKKNYTKTLRLFIEDTTKGKEACRLIQILTNQLNEPQITKIKQRNLDFKLSHHLISAMPLLLFWNGFGVSYEYINKSESMGVYVPLTFDLNFNYYDYGVGIKFYTGKNKANNYKLAGYPIGVLKIRYYIGPEVLYANSFKSQFILYRLQNGISIQSQRHWNISAYLTTGTSYAKYTCPESEYKTGEYKFNWGFYINAGYRF